MKQTISWIFAIIAVFILFNMSTQTPKLSVADVEGRSCITSDDCSCLSEGGIGSGACTNNKCDMTYCVDVKPIGDWIQDNPWQWIKSNILAFLAIVGLLILVAAWPKV